MYTPCPAFEWQAEWVKWAERWVQKAEIANLVLRMPSSPLLPADTQDDTWAPRLFTKLAAVGCDHGFTACLPQEEEENDPERPGQKRGRGGSGGEGGAFF